MLVTAQSMPKLIWMAGLPLPPQPSECPMSTKRVIASKSNVRPPAMQSTAAEFGTLRCSSPPSGGGCHGHLNAKGLSLLKELEGWRPNFYYDQPNGKDNDATRCKNIHPPLSRAEGEALLKKDLSGFEKYICQTVTHQLKCPLNCNQFGALVSFAYNTGTSANGFRISKVYEQLQAGCNYKGAAKVWTSSFTNQGLLTSRRKKEVALFTTATSSVSGC
ncbi:hypothetical protein [Absidia glauca]|uniref:Lysozyme n=1 Tax=Absidia glauca TaxID=4829 RepID=A0A163J4A0_ABSGL|nr:hypothetical protein [Absidia glauca]